jgi:hypothetical protein
MWFGDPIASKPGLGSALKRPGSEASLLEVGLNGSVGRFVVGLQGQQGVGLFLQNLFGDVYLSTHRVDRNQRSLQLNRL